MTCIAAGAHHSLAVTEHGALLTWGEGGGGRLGHGDIDSLVGLPRGVYTNTPEPEAEPEPEPEPEP